MSETTLINNFEHYNHYTDGSLWYKYHGYTNFSACCGSMLFFKGQESSFETCNQGITLLVSDTPWAKGEETTDDYQLKIIPTEIGFLNLKFSQNSRSKGYFTTPSGFSPHAAELMVPLANVPEANLYTPYFEGLANISEKYIQMYYSKYPEEEKENFRNKWTNTISKLKKGSISLFITTPEQRNRFDQYKELTADILKEIWTNEEDCFNGNHPGTPRRLKLHVMERA